MLTAGRKDAPAVYVRCFRGGAAERLGHVKWPAPKSTVAWLVNKQEAEAEAEQLYNPVEVQLILSVVER